jgi:hypothetical protein
MPPKIKPPDPPKTCWTQKPYQPAYNLHAIQGPSAVGPYTHFAYLSGGDDQFAVGTGGNSTLGFGLG